MQTFKTNYKELLNEPVFKYDAVLTYWHPIEIKLKAPLRDISNLKTLKTIVLISEEKQFEILVNTMLYNDVDGIITVSPEYVKMLDKQSLDSL